MANPKVLDYARKARGMGKTDAEIAGNLRGIGVSEDEIDDALKEMGSGAGPAKQTLEPLSSNKPSPSKKSMSRPMKVGLTVAVTFVLYAGLFYLLVVASEPEKYPNNLGTFIVSFVFMVIGIPVGVALTWLLDNKLPDKKKKNTILGIFAFVWGLLFSWLSLCGVAIGQYIIEKEDK